MKLSIHHDTDYHFSEPVFLEPHILRFRPKSTVNRKVLSHNLSVAPLPAGSTYQRDEENNLVLFSWFDGEHDHLTIKAETVIELKEFNVFNWLIYPYQYNQVPFVYGQKRAAALAPAMKTNREEAQLKVYAEALLKECDQETVPFLTTLTRQIHKDFKIIYREEGEPYTPEKTLELREGACRDLAWMQIHMLRMLGFAARFVSGYFFFPKEGTQYDLHGWLEVFVPGGGWIGLDPSHGLVAGHTHIPVSTCAAYQDSMPVSGAIRGSAQTELSSQVTIQRID